VPLCILAAIGLRLWLIGIARRFRWISVPVQMLWRTAAVTVIALTLPTNLILPLSAVSLVQWYDPATSCCIPARRSRRSTG